MWLAAVLSAATAAVSGEEAPALPEPSAAAVQRAEMHVAALKTEGKRDPSDDNVWHWLTEATNEARGHYRWGKALDAGTGVESMSWLCTQPTESIVGVTAAEWMWKKMLNNFKGTHSSCITPSSLHTAGANTAGETVVLVGNWLKAERGQAALTQHPVYTSTTDAVAVGGGGGFDTVLADYLLGSIEHYSAFGEDKLLDILLSSVATNGLFLFCGREPYQYPLGPAEYGGVADVDAVVEGQGKKEDGNKNLNEKRVDGGATGAAPTGSSSSSYSKAAWLVLDTERVRDASMMLSHQRPYREFPQAWVEATLEKKGMEVVQSKHFPSTATASYLNSQLKWARKEARKVAAPSLSAALLEQISMLQRDVDRNKMLQQEGGVAVGGLYCLVAKRNSHTLNTKKYARSSSSSGGGSSSSEHVGAGSANRKGDADDSCSSSP